ncbi:host cell division inhibitor Icd-like protein [Serratia bockelmannii]|uniref:host cell division inhibitor Icd-like protein n=1 Tax=Serratia bockelmannii TaxID=2703793 RepID=UPI003314EA2F
MAHKTKAAMPGRQCYYTKLVRTQNNTLIDQVNRRYFCSCAGGKFFPDVHSPKYLGQYAKVTASDESTGCGKWEPKSHLAKPVVTAPTGNVVQPFGSMPRFLNSERPSSLSQLLVLVFASFANSSNCALSSVGMRMGSIGERPLPLGCLSRVVDMHMPIELLFKSIGIYHNTYNPITTTPRSVCGTSEASNHKLLNEVTAMATADSNTFAHPKFTWRFLALSRTDREAKPCRLSVDAATERDARRVLAPYFILSLAARLPLQGVMKTITPSTIEEISIPPASVLAFETAQEVNHG